MIDTVSKNWKQWNQMNVEKNIIIKKNIRYFKNNNKIFTINLSNYKYRKWIINYFDFFHVYCLKSFFLFIMRLIFRINRHMFCRLILINMFSIYLLVVQRVKDWVQARLYDGLWYNDYNEIPSQAPVSDDLCRLLYIYLLFWFFLQKKK